MPGNASAQHPVNRAGNIRRNSRESSYQCLGNVLVLSGPLPGNISHNTDECPHNGWRNCWEASWQYPGICR
jgi:hypothetical protein